jgi:peptidoglycan/xylan/chitin deacetylase (PgdA/CDA1 family)
LADDSLFEIGAHTDKHSRLSSLSVDEQRTDIFDSKRKLEATLQRRVSSFSYPFGGRPDYTPETTRTVQETGFDCACSTTANHVHKGADRYQLPRYIVRDWDGDEFARRFKEWWRG